MRSIGEAFYEGYLHIDDYYQDGYFESEAFCEYATSNVGQLPFESKTIYLMKLADENWLSIIRNLVSSLKKKQQLV